MNSPEKSYNLSDFILPDQKKIAEEQDSAERNIETPSEPEYESSVVAPRLRVNLERSFEFHGKQWRIEALPLGDPYSLSVQLDTDIESGGASFMLDWPNMVNQSTEARMHLYASLDGNVSFEVKRERMQTWQEAILAYNSIMTDLSGSLTQNQAEEMVNHGRLPRLHSVVIPTNTPGLVQLLTTLGYLSRPEGMVASWSDLVNNAATGTILETWLSQKGARTS